ncbi:pseudouridine synthase [Finegoldia magna]|uniref:Pseudouridine synthase n=1 Tax=Finegoldia magna ATCC 53516 TaxID=525282 RepID=D6SAV5_FINMA|nr:pseudouridine synthase [Finegoldia magna]EFH92605.1 pseudouridylate synthase [Finegoldia magna ATCC 53516]
MRINKFIAQSGYCSRRKADELIKNSKVCVNGTILLDLSYQVNDSDIVEVEGKKISKKEEKIYIAINKPIGYTSTVKDKFADKKVVDLIKFKTRVYPVGRLDKDSHGLLILTNDGELTYELTHPKFEHKKVYEVLVKGRPTKDKIQELKNGIVLDGYKLKKSSIEFIANVKDNTKYMVTIYEGRNRQIRKMFDYINHPVLDLKRVQIGYYKMEDNLKSGEYVLLKNEDLDLIRGKYDRSKTCK